MLLNFRKWLSHTFSPRAPDDLRTLAFKNGLDRRKFPRVLLPNKFRSEHLPIFKQDDRSYEIKDLSLGGVCLVDKNEDLNLNIGDIVRLDCSLNGHIESVSLQLAGMSYQKKHFEFKEISTQLREHFSRFVECGLVGQKMQRSVLSMTGQIETSIIELWIGVDGSTFCFHSDPNYIAVADLNFLDEKRAIIDFYQDSLPQYSPKQRHPLKGQILPPEKRAQLIVLIANFPFLSPRLSNLVDSWRLLEKIMMKETG